MRITGSISLDPSEIEETFHRASGPGGQNVNKVETAVQLRFDVRNSPSLDEEVKDRLTSIAGHRMTRDGVLVITAQQHRTQERNRQDARERLADLIRQALVRPKRRRPTRPSLGAKRRRLEGKKARSSIKSLRSSKPSSE
ncbi:alternative ribosome rescue aminoacyl-tRNA hydrolase ArfB [Fodinicurvata sp. EGI_FJ10296]|uniref:alternative ribosome rescue aminoacyl-tRNA hydrolase ArfB n=1 Tax=Fodinicurvata sp. EGI_FJ10296 TaxID=3231908 RepID=UPI0034535517